MGCTQCSDESGEEHDVRNVLLSDAVLTARFPQREQSAPRCQAVVGAVVDVLLTVVVDVTFRFFCNVIFLPEGILVGEEERWHRRHNLPQSSTLVKWGCVELPSRRIKTSHHSVEC